MIRLQDEREVGALQIRADFSAAPVRFFVNGDGGAACESMMPDALVASHVEDEVLSFGMITSRGLRGPVDVARCRVEVTGDVHPGQFAIEIEDVTNSDGDPIWPQPDVVLRGVLD